MQFLRNLKHIFMAFLIVFVTIFGVVRIFGADFLLPITHFFVYREGNQWLDVLYKYKLTPSEDIAIIKIDDTTLNILQQKNGVQKGNLKMLTIPKSVYIDLIEKLESIGVKGIAFDIVFQNIDPDEEKFARVMQDYKNVVIATTVEREYGYTESHSLEGVICDDCFTGIPRSVYKDIPWGLVTIESTHDRRMLSMDISSAPYASMKPEGERDIYTLPVALYKATGGDMVGLFPKNGRGTLTLQPFFGGDTPGNPPRPYKSYSLSEILSLPLLQKSLAGKYVFVGESGTMIHDSFVSPVTGRLMDGVESHAHFLDGILQKRYLQSWSVTDPYFFAVLMVLMVLMIWIYMVAPKYVSLLIAFLITLWIIWISRYGYAKHGIVPDIAVLLMVGSIISFPVTYIYRFFIVEKEMRILTSAFSHYVDGRVVDTIARSGHSIELGGESRRLTVLFSDIAGFTTLSEKLSPSDLFHLMSNYLGRMTDILTKQGGTLDKYIGDAVMGFYGAPLHSDYHAIDACQTAIKMREALPIFNVELAALGHEPIDFRIGIATGDVVVGNIGSNDRFNYTVLGDTVNLASRLEGTSKEYGTHILVSSSTYEDAKNDFFFRKLDKIAVKGKSEGVLIYELIADIRDKTIDTSIYMKYEQGLEKYFAGEYLLAGKFFESNIAYDPPSKVMAHRCLDIIEGRIKLENGVYSMLHK